MTKKFAEGFCFKKIFIFFLLGCLLGTYYEEILNLIKTGTYSTRQGLIYGPFSPIYGLGITFFVAILGKHNDKRSLFYTFMFASLIGGIAEYSTSYIADKFFDVEFWDYSNYFLNIGGRTTIPFMIGWGAGGTILMKGIYPFLSKHIEKLPPKIFNPLFYIILVFIILDMILTYSAFYRMDRRDHNIKANNFYEEYIDKNYNDKFMIKKFPVMYEEK